jgi:hypothetical protein
MVKYCRINNDAIESEYSTIVMYDRKVENGLLYCEGDIASYIIKILNLQCELLE